MIGRNSTIRAFRSRSRVSIRSRSCDREKLLGGRRHARALKFQSAPDHVIGRNGHDAENGDVENTVSIRSRSCDREKQFHHRMNSFVHEFQSAPDHVIGRNHSESESTQATIWFQSAPDHVIGRNHRAGYDAEGYDRFNPLPIM